LALRKGKTKTTLEASIDASLLAVEIYNKPRTSFRSEGFITLMIIAWTRLFHAHFNNTIGEKYYYKAKNGRYKLIDGEKKAWELSTCVKKYNSLSEPVKSNLEFFIKLRNKIEHRHIDKREIDTLIFGECQSLLFNFESLLVSLFGDEYSINESLVYSLQFSQIRTQKQQKASKSALSKDLADIVSFIETYKNGLTDDVFNSLEYSLKLIQIPKIANANRTVPAIEFVKWDELSAEDREAYEKISVLIKDKKVKVEGANVRRLKPGAVIENVNNTLGAKSVTSNLHVVLYKLFRIRPPNGADDPFDTNTEYCLYDETHGDYVYQETWVEFIIHFFQSTDFTPADLRAKFKKGEFLNIEDYKI